MKIAQIAPLAESVPPRLYGGTEKVVSCLTDELVRLGHDVSLFAIKDSQTSAMLERIRARAAEFDVLHLHVEHPHLPHLPPFRPLAHKTVTTLHSRLDLPELAPLHNELQDMPLVSISDSQRRPLPNARWLATVYHGLASGVCPFNPAPRGRYLAFLGRVSPEIGLDRAIAVARRSGMRLRIAAKIDRGLDERHWRERIAPLIDGESVEFVGELEEARKPAFLGNATALLFPIDSPEPLGLAMIEAMSCGTPVIAWRNGWAPEIVDHGSTGLLVASVEEAIAAVEQAARLDRERVRLRFEERFSAARMARDYLAAYRSLKVRKVEVML